MSYEGYTQNICDNGHLFDSSEGYFGDYSDNNNHCPDCKATTAWSNSVDQTNGDEVGIIPVEQFQKLLISKAVVQTCNLGHPHQISPAIYRLPKEGELIRHYRNGLTVSARLIPL